MKPTLVLDFDGVLHSYSSGWQGTVVIPDPPVPGAIAWMERAAEFFDISIYSSRSSYADGRHAMKKWLAEWATTELGAERAAALMEKLLFARSKPSAFLSIDDRAITFEGDWSKVDPQQLLSFRPWNKRQ
jgi:hypothetical protein